MTLTKISICVVAVSITVFGGTTTASANTLQAHKHATDIVQTVRAVLATPDNKIDFAKAKFTFDKLVDPKVDINAHLKEIDRIVAAVQVMAGPHATSRQKLIAIRKYIYEGGGWNGHKPYQYDLTDPLGKKLTNKLLSTYLFTRRGNCISMPVLFVILADRLGLRVTLSLAPFHVFVKYAVT